MIKLAKFFGSKFLFLGSITKAAQQIVKKQLLTIHRLEYSNSAIFFALEILLHPIQKIIYIFFAIDKRKY